MHDPVADNEEALQEYGLRLTPWNRLPRAAAIVAAVSHREFKARPITDYMEKLLPQGVIADVKGQFDPASMTDRQVTLWRL